MKPKSLSAKAFCENATLAKIDKLRKQGGIRFMRNFQDVAYLWEVIGLSDLIVTTADGQIYPQNEDKETLDPIFDLSRKPTFEEREAPLFSLAEASKKKERLDQAHPPDLPEHE